MNVRAKNPHRRYSRTAVKVLWASFLLSCMLAAVSGYLYYSQAKKTLMEGLRSHADSLCNSAEKEFIARYSNIIEHQSYILAALPQLDKYLMSSQEELLVARAELEKAFLPISSKSRDNMMIAFVDARGNEIAAVAGNKRLNNRRNLIRPNGNDIVEQKMAELFVRLKAKDSPVFACAGPFRDKNNKPGFLVAAKKQEPEAGGFGGIIVQHYDLSGYIQDIAENKLYGTSVIWIYAANGDRLSSPPENTPRLDPKRFLTGTSYKTNGQIYTAQCSVFENTKPLITVVCSVPAELISSRLMPVILSVAAVFSILVVASFGLSALISQWVSMPIKKLTYATKNISVDNIVLDLPQELTQSEDEIGVLARILTKMVGDVNREITERRKAEVVTKRLNVELEDTIDRLKQTNDELKDFVFIASHDLREPVRKIAAFGTMLEGSLRSKLTEDDAENLKFMIDGARRMIKMIEGLLIYSKVSFQPQSPQSIDLNKVVMRLQQNEFAAVIEEKQAVIEIPRPLPWVEIDPDHLIQLIRHFITNGIKYQEKDHIPHITITSRPAADGMVRIEIADNGIGIKPEYQGAIFTMFKRLHTLNEYEGTGIGLTVCRKIVERHGGKIGVQSQPGKGAAFWFTLPAAKVEAHIPV